MSHSFLELWLMLLCVDKPSITDQSFNLVLLSTLVSSYFCHSFITVLFILVHSELRIQATHSRSWAFEISFYLTIDFLAWFLSWRNISMTFRLWHTRSIPILVWLNSCTLRSHLPLIVHRWFGSVIFFNYLFQSFLLRLSELKLSFC